MLVTLPVAAGAQFGGMPGMPGGMPVPGGGGSGEPSAALRNLRVIVPPACRELLALRDETQRHGLAIQKANERKVSVQEACRLFKNFLAAESKFIKGIEENGRTCGAPPDLLKQIRESHAKASQTGRDVCEAAALGPRAAGPQILDFQRLRAARPTGDFWKPDEFEPLKPDEFEPLIGPR
jgi:hypothetical protein